jgi:hypothetical protein
VDGNFMSAFVIDFGTVCGAKTFSSFRNAMGIETTISPDMSERRFLPEAPQVIAEAIRHEGIRQGS